MKLEFLLNAIAYGSIGGFIATLLRCGKPVILTLSINIVMGITAYHFVELWFFDSGFPYEKIKAIALIAAIFSGTILNIILVFLESIKKDPLTLILKLWGKK